MSAFRFFLIFSIFSTSVLFSGPKLKLVSEGKHYSTEDEFTSSKSFYVSFEDSEKSCYVNTKIGGGVVSSEVASFGCELAALVDARKQVGRWLVVSVGRVFPAPLGKTKLNVKGFEEYDESVIEFFKDDKTHIFFIDEKGELVKPSAAMLLLAQADLLDWVSENHLALLNQSGDLRK